MMTKTTPTTSYTRRMHTETVGMGIPETVLGALGLLVLGVGMDVSVTGATASPTSSPTASPTEFPYPSTPLRIDLMDVDVSVEEDNTTIGFHSQAFGQAGVENIEFFCSSQYTVLGISETAYNNCDASARHDRVGLPRTCTFVGEVLRFSTRIYAAGTSAYFASFTGGVMTADQVYSSGGACTSGAKIAVNIVDITDPANSQQYGCFAGMCEAQKICHSTVCNWGRCQKETLVPADTSCDDGNSLTEADQCSDDGRCAGMANYNFTLSLEPAPGVTPAWGSSRTVQNFEAFNVVNQLVSHLSSEGFQFDDVDTLKFDMLVDGDSANCTFFIRNHRQFSEGDIRQALDTTVDLEFGVQLDNNVFRVTVAEVTFVSDTPYPTTTTTTTTTTSITSTTHTTITSSIITTITTVSPSASPSVSSSVAPTASPVKPDANEVTEDDNTASFPVLYVGAAAGGAVVIFFTILVCCCCRRKRDKSSAKNRHNSAATYQHSLVSETMIDAETREVLAGKRGYSDSNEASGYGPRRLTFHAGKTKLTDPTATPMQPSTEARSSGSKDEYVDADDLEVKQVKIPPKPPSVAKKPSLDNYLDLSDNPPAKASPLQNNPFVVKPLLPPSAPPPLPAAPPPPMSPPVDDC